MKGSRVKNRVFNSEKKLIFSQNFPKLQSDFYHQFSKDQKIFYEGHLPYGIFILTSGQAEIKYYNSKIENVVSPAFLGISAFINKSAYLGTATANSDCEIYFISYSAYQNLNENQDPIIDLFK